MDLIDTIKEKYRYEFFLIQKDSQINCDKLAAEVTKKFPNKKNVSEYFNLLYIYFLVDKEFGYPTKNSKILYIVSTVGEKCKNVRSAGFRFMHFKGNADYKQNITLHKFYMQGNVIGLIICECAENENCREIENAYRFQFLNEFGSLPIADGASYSSKKGEFIVKSTSETIDSINEK